eukprot:CAMPEP_0168322258 /NCGR_PEP_ID=MMETSP0213-20121227/2779_1 /TAXON_ID=151035 /ORGANISM="Euplotes harpa, Strain FSP1.4" /LENGTH=133 /DNA_ID=CAMNT_0008324105 /DNA_START=468 /DNA_END=872 /DNA_ORIENTATION=-
MILDRIDPEHKYIQHRLYRDSCLPLNGNYIKDLTILGRDMNKTIIIDNSIIAFSLNLDNGILIHSFCGDKQDVELYKLVEILEYALDLSKSYQPEGVPHLHVRTQRTDEHALINSMLTGKGDYYNDMRFEVKL